jgi:PAS domain S-box-containing protein
MEDRIDTVRWAYVLQQMEQSIAYEKPAVVQQRLLEHIVSGFQAATGSISLADAGTAELTLIAATGDVAEYVGRKIGAGDGVLGWVAAHRKPLLLNGDIAGDDRFQVQRRTKTSTPPPSALCWPLLADNQLLGALSINRSHEQPPFTEADLAEGKTLVGFVSLAVQHMRLHLAQQHQIAALAAATQKLAAQQRELEKTRARSRASEARLLHLIAHSPTVIYSAPPGTPAQPDYVSANVESVTGYSPGEILAHPEAWLRCLHSADAPAYLQRLAQLRPDKLETGRYRFRRKDGAYRWMQDQIHLVVGEAHEPLEIVGSMTDISELVETKHELGENRKHLAATEQMLLQAEKLASIGQLAAGVAHEINNPLGYISSNCAALKRYLDQLWSLIAVFEAQEEMLPAAAREAIRTAKAQSDLDFLRADIGTLLAESEEGLGQVKKIIQDLKGYVRVNEEDRQPADLHVVLDSALNLARNELKYKAEIVKQYGEIPPVECVPSQITQVFVNLLVNAAQAIATSGIITLRSGAAGGEVWLEVADTGCGISEENMHRLFDPFFTTKPVGKGTGLGLWLVYNIVSKHGGHIQARSTVGKGTTFRLTLPASRAAPPARQAGVALEAC